MRPEPLGRSFVGRPHITRSLPDSRTIRYYIDIPRTSSTLDLLRGIYTHALVLYGCTLRVFALFSSHLMHSSYACLSFAFVLSSSSTSHASSWIRSLARGGRAQTECVRVHVVSQVERTGRGRRGTRPRSRIRLRSSVLVAQACTSSNGGRGQRRRHIPRTAVRSAAGRVVRIQR
ncbi:hypothetical protein C8R45DRAFT_249382 [Mycena sanguinolenta]|nr:hypothetical protein C8R45DRAFT_249382 [Mycena sanguinolenta]